MHSLHYSIRPATPSEIGAIRAMQERSMRGLGRGFYSPAAIESFIRLVGTMDEAVITEGHYFVATDCAGGILGSGGWSKRRPGYAKAGGDHIAQALDEALVRSVFVDPHNARAGIGSALLSCIESNAAANGIAGLRLAATLSGVPLYARFGYEQVTERRIALADGLEFAVVDMAKTLAPRRLPRAAARPGGAQVAARSVAPVGPYSFTAPVMLET